MKKTFGVVALLFLIQFNATLTYGMEQQNQLTDTEKNNSRILYSAMLAGNWLVNNQNKETMGGSHPVNADYGRWIYEYIISRDFWRGSVCWTTSTGIMDLAMLYERTGEERYKEALERAALYLKSLQVLDCRNKRNYGAVRETNQLDNYIFPRDGMTSVGGFLALYRFTGDGEYLERAKLYGDWYLNYAINPETGWTYWSFPFDTDQLGDNNKQMGYFQAGGGVFLYQLYKVTGDRKYLEKGLKHLCDKFLEYYTDEKGNWKLDQNNDDFGTIALLCAYRELGDKKYWDAAIKRLEQLIVMQREDGAIVPGTTGGCYISALTAMEILDIARDKGIKLDREHIEKFIRRTSDFALTMQESDPAADLKSYGGFYGQKDLDDNFQRDWVHARATTYSVLFNLRYERKLQVPFYSSYGW